MPNNSLRFFRNKQQRIELTFHAPIIIPVPVRSEASKHKLFHPLLKKNKKKQPLVIGKTRKTNRLSESRCKVRSF